MVRLLTASALLTVAGAASAAVSGLTWVEVAAPAVGSGTANGDFFAAAAWNGNAAGWRTFDLYVLGDEGTQINAINLGTHADHNLTPFALFSDGPIFNHSNGNNFPSASGQPPFQALLEWDSYVAMGDTPAGDVGQVPGSINLNDGSVGLRGSWFGDPLDPTIIGASGQVRIMRITVGAQATYLGTPMGGSPLSSLQVGQIGFSETFVIPNAIPTPGAVALLGLGGLTAIRRRR